MLRLKTSLQLVTVQQSDIDKMLAFYDSGMSDISTSNAVSLALQRLLKPDHRVRVIRDSANQEGSVQIGDFGFSLPDGLLNWLERAERASTVKPISFGAALPEDWLLRPVEFPQKASGAERTEMIA